MKNKKFKPGDKVVASGKVRSRDHIFDVDGKSGKIIAHGVDSYVVLFHEKIRGGGNTYYTINVPEKQLRLDYPKGIRSLYEIMGKPNSTNLVDVVFLPSGEIIQIKEDLLSEMMKKNNFFSWDEDILYYTISDFYKEKFLK